MSPGRIILLLLLLGPPSGLGAPGDGSETSAPGRPVPLSPWSIRYAQMPDQKVEWDIKGYLPNYQVVWKDRESPEVSFKDYSDGRCRGFVLLGREFRLPEKLPARLSLSFEYQTFCQANDPPFKRSGMVYFLLLEPGQWKKFAEIPSGANRVNSWADRKLALYAGGVHRSQEDTVGWVKYRVGDLRLSLKKRAGKTVVLALVWGAAHFNLFERGAFRNFQFHERSEEQMVRDFFDCLDLSRPGLERVKAAADANDFKAARHALVAYMKSRNAPPPLLLQPLSSKRAVSSAEKIREHEFRFVGCPPYKLGKTILWNEDPFSYDQWAIALNRHFHWLTLGRVYVGTKEEKYAREFVSQLDSWTRAMPVRIGRNYIEGVTPEATLSLDAGIRMGQTWFPAYYHFLHSPSFTEEAHFTMLRSFLDHAVYLEDPCHFRHGSNWGMMELNGLYHIGAMLPEFKDAARWRQTAISRLQSELDYQFYPDGAQTELTPGYHGVSVRNALGVLDIARHAKQELPGDLMEKLERTFDYYLRIMMPDGSTPALNDSGWGRARPWLQTGLKYFPRREEWRYAVSKGQKRKLPPYTSCKFDYAGWYIMRTGWSAEDKYLLFDTGPFGTGHQHEDKLHFILYALGRRLITDPGTYSYDSSDWRKYVLRARGHNTVLVDGMGQSRSRQVHTYRNEKPQANRWISTSRFDYAEGAYADGFGPQHDKTVTHLRRILFVKPNYWILIDEFRPSDSKPHTYEALFHFDAPEAEAAPATCAITTRDSQGGNVAIFALQIEGIEAEIIKGQKKPHLQGWLPTGKHNVLRPAPVGVFRKTSSGVTLMAYAIIPFEIPDALPEIKAIEVESSLPHAVANLSFQNGTLQTIVIKAGQRQVLKVADADIHGEVAVVQDGRILFELGQPKN